MLEIVDKKYCKGDLVQLMPHTDEVQLIVSPDEIILLKLGKKILVNKYSNHPSRYLFPFSSTEQSDYSHFTEIFEYGKLYLSFGASIGNYWISKYYFFRGLEKTLCLEEPLNMDERAATEETVIVTREKLESMFNSDNFDSMFIFDRRGRVSFARCKKDNIKIGDHPIMTDEEIVEAELKNRETDRTVASYFREDDEENHKTSLEKQSIENIREFKLYAPVMFGKYDNMLLTSKDGKFDLKWFRLEFVCKDTFRLTTGPIQVTIPREDFLTSVNQDEIPIVRDPLIDGYTTSPEEQLFETVDDIAVKRMINQGK